jgi:redox-sensitive bicupin YhaK (pirin superfamily)
VASPILHRIAGRARDIGVPVRRILPAPGHRMVGPFIFLDHMGPVTMPPGQGMDVRPHPHIGLATVTYLFQGEIEHRDSLGVVQTIRPGDVNWMVAGRGIAHSERTGAELRKRGAAMNGIQSWVALPRANEEIAPSFRHHPKASLPARAGGGVSLRLIAGTLMGLAAPVEVFSPTFYADLAMEDGAEFALPPEHAERAAYVADGALSAAGETVMAGTLAIFAAGDTIALRARGTSRVMILGGAPMDGERLIWWNFVASSAGRIERAKADWREGRFAMVPGDPEFIPLPDDPPPRARRPAHGQGTD